MEAIITSFGLDIRLLLIQMLNFGLAMLVLWHFVYKPLLKVIEERRQKIEQGLKDAQKYQQELEKLEGKKETEIQKARKKAQEILSMVKTEAEKKAQEILKSAQSKAQKQTQEALKKAEAEKIEMIKEAEKEIAKEAILAAEKILKNS